MKTISFQEVNAFFQNEEGTISVPAFVDQNKGVVVICNELSNEEIESIVRNRKIWIHLEPDEFPYYNAFALFTVKDYFTQVIPNHEGGFKVSGEDDDEFLQNLTKGTGI